MDAAVREAIRRLPKTDLHCHLDGSLRPATLIELARKRGVPLPADDPEALVKAMNFGGLFADLNDYLKGFSLTTAVMQHADDIHRAAYELACDAADEGVWYLEVRYAPNLSTAGGLSIERVMDAWWAGQQEAKQDRGIESRMIVCILRHLDFDHGMLMAGTALSRRRWGVVALDAAGPEKGYPAALHREAFDSARRGLLWLTVHAGEAFGPASIHQALVEGRADRIGHGTRLLEDPELMAFVADHQLPIEVCLVSNVQTRACESFEAHPLRRLLAAGIKCTLNTDNRLISATSLTREITEAVLHHDLPLSVAARLMLNGFESAFLPLDERSALATRAKAELQRVVPSLWPRGPVPLWVRPGRDLPAHKPEYDA